MRRSTRMHAAFRQCAIKIYMVLVACFLLSACDPPPRKSGPTPKTRTESAEKQNAQNENTQEENQREKQDGKPEKQALADLSCEKKIRREMEDRSISFQSIPGLAAEIERAKADSASLVTVDYAIDQTESQNTSVGVGYSAETKTGNSNFGVQLALVKEQTAGHRMELTIDFSANENGSGKEISQRFLVSETCSLVLAETSYESIVKEQEEYSYSLVTYYLNGERVEKTDRFKIPSSGKLANFMGDNLAAYDDNTSFYLKDLGLLQIKARHGIERSFPAFSLNISLKGSDFELVSGEQTVFKIFIGEDENSPFKVAEYPGSLSWRVPKAVWDENFLATNPVLIAQIKFQIPSNYLYAHDSIRIVTDRLPEYQHFSAYWGVEEISSDAKNGLKTVRLTENKYRTYMDVANDKDLESNSTIQTDLPQVQQIADQISRQEPNNRRAQIALVLKYLSENYTYDSEMAKNNVVRRLTTAEALERKMGVCQHYAVIFTAIARALKVPARIVVGLLFSGGSAGWHAWVEAESAPGMWTVLEPQSATSLAEMHTRFYFPVLRGFDLEGQPGGVADFYQSALQTRFTILSDEPSQVPSAVLAAHSSQTSKANSHQVSWMPPQVSKSNLRSNERYSNRRFIFRRLAH